MYMCKAVAPMMICALMEHVRRGGGVQSPRRGLTENFNMAKINNLAIPGGGGVPLDPSAHVERAGFLTAFLVYECSTPYPLQWPRCKKTLFCQGSFIL